MVVNDSKKSPKVAEFFCCNLCNYTSSKTSDYSKHLLTRKHKKNENDSKMVVKSRQKSPKVGNNYNCECGKIYKYDSGYYRHKKICNYDKLNINDENKIIEPNNISSDLILNIIKQNQEFKDLIIEQNKTIIEISKNNQTNNIINNNSNNKTFNLQLFLNETCKDAMNITDFVDSIKIQLSDIESIGELGFVNGMSKLIIKNLKALEENKRPVHCSDPKRESLYVKHANVWEKEDPDNKKIKKAIKSIAHKNICAIPEWKEKYPECIDSHSKKSDQYNHIVIEAMGGSGDNDAEKADKIVKKIAKEITINKNNSD
jgi:hypothetical protein